MRLDYHFATRRLQARLFNAGPNTASMRATASSLHSWRTWLRVSKVRLTRECPIRSQVILGSTLAWEINGCSKTTLPPQ
jgi:hypothetical protein